MPPNLSLLLTHKRATGDKLGGSEPITKNNIMNEYHIMNEYQKGEFNKATILKEEIISLGYQAQVIEGDNGLGDYRVILTDNGQEYQVTRNYNGHITLFAVPYKTYPSVSSYKRGEVHTANKGQNVKVLTKKKLAELITQENATNTELARLEAEAKDKEEQFLASIKGLNFTMGKDNKHGYLIKNGLEFNFTIEQDGYISKKITISYKVDNTIENFLKLAENKY